MHGNQEFAYVGPAILKEKETIRVEGDNSRLGFVLWGPRYEDKGQIKKKNRGGCLRLEEWNVELIKTWDPKTVQRGVGGEWTLLFSCSCVGPSTQRNKYRLRGEAQGCVSHFRTKLGCFNLERYARVAIEDSCCGRLKKQTKVPKSFMLYPYRLYFPDFPEVEVYFVVQKERQ